MARKSKKGVALFFIVPIAAAGLVASLIAVAILSAPDVTQMKKCMTTSMFKVHLCPGGKNYVPLSRIADVVKWAIIVSEDGAFYQHEGFDWYELRVSFETNLEEGGFVRGGSTITQQLAKNVFLSPEKSLVRKVREAYLAHQIEQNFSKHEILERYLNVVEFGPSIYGIKAAANYYFGKSPSDLHPLEAAYLAFLLPNPKGYHSYFKKKQLTPYARKRVLQIVHRLQSFGKISKGAEETAKAYVDSFPWKWLSWSDFQSMPSNFGNTQLAEDEVPEDSEPEELSDSDRQQLQEIYQQELQTGQDAQPQSTEVETPSEENEISPSDDEL